MNLSFIDDIVQKPNSDNCLDLIFVASPYEKVIFMSDTKSVTAAIRNFMMDMPSPGSFRNISLSKRAQSM